MYRSPSTREPSARTWITRPRTPRSLMTTSLPRPRTRYGSSRARANRTIARSSKALRTVANRSAGPPTRIVVNRPSGSSRDVLIPESGAGSPIPTTSASKAGGWGAFTPAARVNADRWRGGPATASGPPLRARGRPRRRRRPADRARALRRTSATWRAGSSRIVAASSSASASNASSSTRRAAPASTSCRALARWWPAACGYGTTTIGSPSAVTSASVEEPARPTTRSAAASAVSMSSRRNGYGLVAGAQPVRQRLPSGQRRRRTRRHRSRGRPPPARPVAGAPRRPPR